MFHRANAAAALFVGLLAVFSALLWNIQITHGAEYAEAARRSFVQTETVPAARGRLLDRKGRVLAEDRAVWTARISENAGAETVDRVKALCKEEGITWDGEGELGPVPASLLAKINGEGLDGVTFSPAVRRAGSLYLAPHLLGRVGKISPEEWPDYQAKGYALDSLVGKDGAEAAFENLLRGTPGTRIVERDRAGQITRQGYSRLPRPGQDVTLTIDRDLQRTARSALKRFLEDRPAATGASAVVLDVRDGGVLALASLPDYDPETFSAQYEKLSADPGHPLLNRAIQGLYAPGSVFKLVTAAAALEEGVLTPETRILDTGKYTYYDHPQPQCWLYRREGRTHGLETVDRAIADSCNVFFYDAGRRVGIEALERYANALGLGVPTGIELAGEETGVTAGPAYSAKMGLPWYEGSVLSAAIGQENNRFTPLQLAHFTATLVEDGSRWRVHIKLHAQSMEASKSSETMGAWNVSHQARLPRRGEGLAFNQSCLRGKKDAPAERLGEMKLKAENLSAIKKGMAAVTRDGSLKKAFADLPVTTGAKTGSAQVDGAEESNAVLVAFAPFEKPEIALALVAEQGGEGAALGEAAAEIIRAWCRGK